MMVRHILILSRIRFLRAPISLINVNEFEIQSPIAKRKFALSDCDVTSSEYVIWPGTISVLD